MLFILSFSLCFTFISSLFPSLQPFCFLLFPLCFLLSLTVFLSSLIHSFLLYRIILPSCLFYIFSSNLAFFIPFFLIQLVLLFLFILSFSPFCSFLPFHFHTLLLYPPLFFKLFPSSLLPFFSTCFYLLFLVLATLTYLFSSFLPSFILWWLFFFLLPPSSLLSHLASAESSPEFIFMHIELVQCRWVHFSSWLNTDKHQCRVQSYNHTVTQQTSIQYLLKSSWWSPSASESFDSPVTWPLTLGWRFVRVSKGWSNDGLQHEAMLCSHTEHCFTFTQQNKQTAGGR